VVTTTEENVIKGTITESDLHGRITTYVEVGMERVDEVMTGENARRGTLIYPVFLLVAISLGLLAGFTASAGLGMVGFVALLLLTVWMRGAVR
jgi:hypothetical protein